MKNTKSITRETWGQLDGKPVYLFTLTNARGQQVKITNYGATITSWITPDKLGNTGDIVLGFDTFTEYLKPNVPYFGAVVGRFANRIAKGKFTLDGITYSLPINNGDNHLHGGKKGFDKVVWDASTAANDTLKLSYLSKDGEEGYPGNFMITILYSINDENELVVEYEGTTDKSTPVNLSQHTYFNLTGDENNPILDHILIINSDHYTPVDNGSIPTGELKAVKGTPFDFNQPQKVGARIGDVPGGYDHNYVLGQSGVVKQAATLHETSTGRTIEVLTTEPGMQFYTGNYLDGTFKGVHGKSINKNCGLCLETQHFPDSPNRPSFPSTILNPGEKFKSITKYKFSINDKI
jgi:aldose 1-epimerase